MAVIDCWRGVLTHTILDLAQPLYLATRVILTPDYWSHASPLWLAFHAIMWTYLVTRVSMPFYTSPLRHLPSPPSHKNFLLGHFDFKPPMDNVLAMLKTPNDGVLVLWSPFYLWCQIIPTTTSALMDVLNTHTYDWEKPALTRKFLVKTLGEGLAFVEGSQHKAMRRVVAPAFSGRHIRDLAPLFYAKGSAYADALAREAQGSSDGSLEMMSHMSRVTLDIIGAAAVGKDFNTIENDHDRLASLYARITDPSWGPLIIFILIQNLLPQWMFRWLKGTPYARVAEAQIELRKEVSALMQEKRQKFMEKNEQEKDFIAIILRSGDFSDGYLVDQLLTFLAAGHDTTASALTWVTWLLSIHPQVQDRLRAECNTHLRDRADSEIDASTFDTKTMPYLTAVCNETLRFYPTVPGTARVAAQETKIGKASIPTGTEALICPWAINRDPTLWGEDAGTFNPERWLHGENAAHGGAASPYALLTFIHGPRSCIGQAFAQLEMKVLLAVLVMRFKFELSNPEEKVEIGGFPTIKPKNGLRLKLQDLKDVQEEGAAARS